MNRIESVAGFARSVLAGIVAVSFSVSPMVQSGAANAADGAGPAIFQSATRGNASLGVIPDIGPVYEYLAAKWWQWAYSFPAARVPFYNTGGAVDLSEGQSGPVWFLAGANSGLSRPRTGVVPFGKMLFLPMANLINDYPCPPSLGFEPDPGESIAEFLSRTADEFLPELTDLFAEIDGVPLRDLASYRAKSWMFYFTADPALTTFDPCITGTTQPGVAAGYWLLFAPLSPGRHTLRFGAPSWGQDVTYVLNVMPRH